ncbi:MAG: metalloregulator ArsR/SmtB family transcription factor [Deltaproteobacteria bacterium]|jgi:ArsR family transcriptional regulator|nr:metalloregulator ArsR/SmtB family transcription factor [Deltaproteobacteria bacterium]MBW2533983.1 metalloregulator ArsR/SmtB family transcription factor [Deltaproteobacteria bacterium]
MAPAVKNLSLVFKALSDETRLAMLALLLRHQELCVCDFVEVLGITQSKASRHLRYLHNAGLLQDRRDTQWVHYRIREQAGQDAREVLRAVRPLLETRPLDDLEQRLARWLAAKERKPGACSGQQPSKDSSR